MHARGEDGSLSPIALEREQDPEFHMGLYGTAGDYIKFHADDREQGPRQRQSGFEAGAVALMGQNHIGDLNMGRMTSHFAFATNDVDLYPDIPKSGAQEGRLTCLYSTVPSTADCLLSSPICNVVMLAEPATIQEHRMETIHFRSVATAALASIMSFVAATVQGSEIKVLADSPLQPALTKVAELFEQETRDRILFTFDPSPAVKKRIEQGERADVVIVQPDFVTSSGKVRSGDRPIIGKVGVGLGNRRDSPVYDISTPEKLKQVLLGADLLVFSNRRLSGRLRMVYSSQS
jgi:hypothetical protein